MVLGLHAAALGRSSRCCSSFAPKLAKEGSLAAWVAAGANRMSGGLRGQRLQRGLVVAQIAVSVILLTGAGLLTRTMLQLSEVNTGLNTERILTMEVPFDFEARKDEDAKALFERMQLEVAAHSGRERGRHRLDDAAACDRGRARRQGGRTSARQRRGDAARRLPHGRVLDSSMRPASRCSRDASSRRPTRSKSARGRDPQQDARRAGSFRTATRSDSAWRGRARCCKFIGLSDEWRTVVGVVGDTKDGGLDAEPRGALFQPIEAGSDVRRRSRDSRGA